MPLNLLGSRLQAGAETETHMRHFLISGASQLHDLHSKLELNHPRGVAAQMHKCIVSHATGKAVFDGNVKVSGWLAPTAPRCLLSVSVILAAASDSHPG